MGRAGYFSNIPVVINAFHHDRHMSVQWTRGAENSMVLSEPLYVLSRSWLRLLGAVGIAASGAFLSVSPNNAPRDEYLALFRRNMWLLASGLVSNTTLIPS